MARKQFDGIRIMPWPDGIKVDLVLTYGNSRDIYPIVLEARPDRRITLRAKSGVVPADSELVVSGADDDKREAVLGVLLKMGFHKARQQENVLQ